MATDATELRSSINRVLEASGDLLLKIGSEPGRTLPNSGVDTSELNKQILAYQQLLDKLELEIRDSLASGQNADIVAPLPDPVSASEGEVPQPHGSPSTHEPDFPDLRVDGLDPMSHFGGSDLSYHSMMGSADDRLNLTGYDF